jgi:putative hemolysin
MHALVRVSAALVAGLVLVASCGGSGGKTTNSTTTTAAGATAPATTTAATEADASAYCTSKGGTVQTRDAMWGTNGAQAQWESLGRSTAMCRFQTLHDNANSRIYVDLTTLFTQSPTLASVAYLSKVPPKPTVAGNPATIYCAALGGSSQFGTGAAGGGWVNKDDPDDTVVALCVFPDGSFIDEWGLTYYAGGVVRGIDLSKAFRYQPAQVPSFFTS